MDIDLFAPGVARQCKGAPDNTIWFALREAAIEFTKRTRLWRQDDTITISASANTVDLDPPADSEIHEILQLSYEGRKLYPATEADMDGHHPMWRYQVYPGNPERFLQTTVDTLTVLPTADATLNVTWILFVAEGATDLPDFLFNRYKAVIEAGAIYRVLMMPAQPWTDPTTAALFATKFEDGIAQGNIDKVRGPQRASMRTKGSFF